MFDDLTAAIKAHARNEHPHEACGLITAAGYRPCVNRAEDKARAFAIAPEDYLAAEAGAGQVLAVVHSHPGGPAFPTARDMAGQIASGVVWGLLALTADMMGDILWWGPGVAVPPLIGRPFRHGPTGSDGRGDCYALIRDWYALERGVTLPEVPRDDAWWAQGGDLYRDNFAAAGFERQTDPRYRPQHGDVFLAQIRSPAPNHGGVYLGDEVILHHLHGRLSRREAVGAWAKHLVSWLRYVG